MGFIGNLLFRLYRIRRRGLRRIIVRIVGDLEGGEMRSKTLRRIYSEYHSVTVGMYSYGGCFNPQLIDTDVEFGRYCSVADGVGVFTRNHPMNHKSMHPIFFNVALGYVKDEKCVRNKVVIGNDVWIGRNVLIIPSVRKIGNGAVIGAGAIVTKDVPDFAVVAGNPAKVLRYRFSQEIIERLNREQWWNKEIEEVKEDMGSFSEPVEEGDG